MGILPLLFAKATNKSSTAVAHQKETVALEGVVGRSHLLTSHIIIKGHKVALEKIICCFYLQFLFFFAYQLFKKVNNLYLRMYVVMLRAL